MSCPWITNQSHVEPGDWTEVCVQYYLRHVGTVCQMASPLAVLWLLEAATGILKLISISDFRLRRLPRFEAV